MTHGLVYSPQHQAGAAAGNQDGHGRQCQAAFQPENIVPQRPAFGFNQISQGDDDVGQIFQDLPPPDSLAMM